MNCEEITKLMDGYLDGELDPITNERIEQHLQDCNNCDQAYRIHSSLIRAVSSAAPYYKAPAELRERIQSSLREAIAERTGRKVGRDVQPPSSRGQAEARTAPWGTQWTWLGLAAAIIFSAIIILNVVPRSQQRGADQFLATELIASHARSLMANHLTDVTSSDHHTVKPWLDAKLDFAPAVVDLSSDGFPLLGGRLDYLENRAVAALVYQRRKHFINLFVWPAEPNTTGGEKMMSRQGYQLLHWADSDFNYWAVSDVSESDLQIFKRLVEKQIPHH